MRVSQSNLSLSVYKGVRQATEALYGSMRKLSSGQRVNRPGDAPADFGISEQLRFQISNSGEARRNVENARNMMGAADSWMQQVSNILSRMSELAISASDASKSASDRNNLNEEFTQLKDEVSRISREAKYNGVQVAGKDQILSYDQDKDTFFFSQLDGKETYNLPVKMMSGLQSDNKLDFQFDKTKDFSLSNDGKYIFYVDSQDNLSKYNIEKGLLYRDTANTEDKKLDIDEKGRLWYAAETAAGSGVYSIREQDVNKWQQDTTNISNTDIVDMGSSEFSVYEDSIYYLNNSGDIVSRNIVNPANVTVELASTDISLTTTDGQFAISEEGNYVADVPSAGELRITNIDTKKSSSFSISGVIIDDLTFNSDSSELVFTDTAEGSIHRITVKGGDNPQLIEGVKLHVPTGATGFTGLSLEGSSHRSNFHLHHGPEAGQESFVTTGDVRLYHLGLLNSSVDTLEKGHC